MSTALLDQLQAPLRARAGDDPGAAQALEIASLAGLPVARTESWRYSSLRMLQRALRAGEAAQAADVLDLSVRQPGEAGTPDWQRLPAVVDDERRDAAQSFAWLARAAGCHRLVLDQGDAQPLYLQPQSTLSAELPHRHQQIRIPAGAELTVIEHYRGENDGHLTNLLQQIAIGEGAKVHWLRLVEASEPDHLIVRSEFDLAAGARLVHHSLELSGGWSRHDLRVRLAGKDAELVSHGLLPLTGKRHADTQLEVIHAVGDSRSQMRWRGVAAQRARAIFNGRILIEAGADGSDAALNTASLLLSPHAEIDAKPELEIYADAVKAAHGAAIGQLDPQALFYMRSRGLPKAQARALLMASFCRHALEDLQPELLAVVEARVDSAIAKLDQGEQP